MWDGVVGYDDVRGWEMIDVQCYLIRRALVSSGLSKE